MRSLVKTVMAFFIVLMLCGPAFCAENPVEDALKKGVEYSQEGRNDEAIAEFNKVIALSPKLSDAYYDRGLAYYKKSAIKQAIAVLAGLSVLSLAALFIGLRIKKRPAHRRQEKAGIMPRHAIAALLPVVLLFPGAAGAKTIEECVYLVPAGKVDKKVPAKLKEKLPGIFPMSVKAVVDPERELPQSAYDASRRQYDAQKVIDVISGQLVLTLINERALIITDADLYVPGADFVFGLTDEKKGVCIVSLARLANEFYGQNPDGRLLTERALKKGACELGRSWKVPACQSGKCVMFPSAIPSDIDKERESFCYKCQIALENRSGSRGLIGQKFK